MGDRDQQLLAGRTGGFTGCTQQLINQAFKERREEAEERPK